MYNCMFHQGMLIENLLMLYDDTGLLQDFSKLDSLCKSHHTLFASDTLEFKSLCITLKHQKGESRLGKKKKIQCE